MKDTLQKFLTEFCSRKEVISLIPTDPEEQQELQTPSTYIHMGFATFVMDIYCVRFFSTCWISTANDYHNTLRLLTVSGVGEYIISG